MVDVHTPEQRSHNMAAIRHKNTKPEIVVRRLLCEMGLRYRLHRNDLPGKPDIVMPGRKVAIFVHGCFFHMHKCRYGRVVPATNSEFWHVRDREMRLGTSEMQGSYGSSAGRCSRFGNARQRNRTN